MMEIPEVKNGIIDEIARYLSWEVTVLMGGRHPCRGFYDEDLGGNEEYIAEGFLATYIGFKGDRKNRKELHVFTRNYASTYICDRCMACKLQKSAVREFNFGNFGSTAGWRRTMISHDFYIAFEQRVSPHAQIPG